MPDHLEELFADLRADALPRVRPPGSEAARHTVRRRRTTRTITGTAVAVAVAGVLFVVGMPGGGLRISPAERLRDLVRTAEKALDNQLPALRGQRRSGPVESTGQLTFADLQPGVYTLAIACAGPGVVNADVELARGTSNPSGLGGLVAGCGDQPQVAAITVQLPVGGSVVVSVGGDERATGNAGLAVELGAGEGSGPVQDLVPDPESVWNASRARDVLSARGGPTPAEVTTEQDRITESFAGPYRQPPPGDYEFRLVCAGPGTLSVTVLLVPDEDGGAAVSRATVSEGQVECHDTDPRLEETGTVSLPPGSKFAITAVPDQTARNTAGWAYQFVPS